MLCVPRHNTLGYMDCLSFCDAKIDQWVLGGGSLILPCKGPCHPMISSVDDVWMSYFTGVIKHHLKNFYFLYWGGHGNPLQYSCLENPMDRGAWQAAVHGVTRSTIGMKWLSTRIHTFYITVLYFHTHYSMKENFVSLRGKILNPWNIVSRVKARWNLIL